MTVAALAFLVPINYLDDWYAKTAKVDNVADTYTTVFIRLTMSNITPRSPWLWCVRSTDLIGLSLPPSLPRQQETRGLDRQGAGQGRAEI